MKKLSPRLMKNILIAANRVGVLLVITGLIFLTGWCIQLILSKDIIPYCLPISLITLIGGFCIFTMAIEIPLYLADIRKMSREERQIEKLKGYLVQPKGAMLFKAALIAIILYFLISIFCQLKKYKEFDNGISEKLSSMSSFEDPNIELPTLLSRFYKLARIRIENIISFVKYVAIMLIFIAFCIIKISGYNRNKHRLTISMWERIQKLESEVKELKAGTRAES